ncbi:MAG: KH domain-containing protein [Bulleidia sp.]|nr:KH domain-containing protein [Bulleidia sp.]
MSDLEQVLWDLIQPMVNEPEKVEISTSEGENGKEIILTVKASDDDVARLIGKKGIMASSLRQVMGVASHKFGKRVSIKFCK